MKKGFVLILAGVCGLSGCHNSIDPMEKKVDKLLKQMSVEEKIGQMNQLTGTGVSVDMTGQIKAGIVGSILNETDPVTINALQKVAVTQSRLGIPLVFGRDVIHGFKTIFPIPLGQAATWNPALVEDGAAVAAKEASATGIKWTFAPMVDVCRDPRWGRIAESCGEDPYLTSIMGAAMVKGFQGKDMSEPQSIAACAKHFAGYGAVESGKDYNTTWIPEMQLRDVYLPPFKAVSDAGVASFMCSFNDINGVPSSGNVHLNQDILRGEWKFDGLLVSDWSSIGEMMSHGVCSDLRDAACKAVKAGVDMDMMSYAYIGNLNKLLETGQISEKAINQSVKNILRMKFRLGLFDHPYVNTESPGFYSDDALAKARQTAVESAVLLKNDKNILPLSGNITTVAVIGPLSDAPADQLGTWVFDGEPSHSVTPLQAIKEIYGKRINVVSENGLGFSRDTATTDFKKAVEVAEKADVILYFAGEEAILSGEAHCRADIGLPGAQSRLLTLLKGTGKPVVTVVLAGRPLTIEKELGQSDALLFMFHGGTMTGPAVADLIFGKENPSGKLPVTFPKMVGQVPVYYGHKATGRPAKDIVLIDKIPVGASQTSLGNTSYHLDAGDKPLFPFGYGLSYTTFSYSSVRVSSGNIYKDKNITVECDITNTGKCEGAETAQLYVHDMVASLARPVRELKGFRKIRLKPGETQTVKFELQASQLGFWHTDNTYAAEPGDFQVWISKDSQSGIPVKIYLH